ncbi:DUF4129 domain-containing protein [Alkalinema pantanalense CENA528]|uniref:DUF4129 domain-containing protein n=1 Tax=Alkalinema pantanalense TaxID=1620705 RepID=UPI003D6FBA06
MTCPFVIYPFGVIYPFVVSPLLTAPLEKSNPTWQFRQWIQRFAEWVEVKTASWKFSPSMPNEPVLPTVPSQIWEVLFWLVVLSAVGWISWLVVRWLDPYWVNRRRDRASARLQTARTELPKSSTEWYERAQSYARQQNYAEGCRALYLAMLQQLSDRQIMTADASRTDGEYLRILQSLPTVRSITAYKLLIQVHEQIYYERSTVSEQIFLKCQQAYQTIVEQTSLVRGEN